MYLFRGTTEGFSGSIYPRLGITSASADPIVATLFATTASKHGKSVLQIIPMDKLAERVQDNRGSNRLTGLEAEFVIEASPGEIAGFSLSVSADVARSILEGMGFAFPANIWNLADLNAALHLTRRLNPDEILEFVRRAENPS